MKRVFFFSVIAAASLLTACAGQTLHQSSIETIAATPAVPEEPQYPNVALTPNILYDFLVGEIAGQRGYLDTSVTALSRAAMETHDPRLAERATLVALYAKNYPEGLKTANLWVALQPKNLEAKEALAEILLQLKRMPEAEQQLQQILALGAAGNNLGVTTLKVAAVLAQQNTPDASLAMMAKLIQPYANVPEAHYALAHLAIRVGDLDKALAADEDALKLRPDWEEAAIFKGRVLISKKNNKDAVDFYESYLKTYPRATTLRLNYARFLVDLKQWEKSREQFKRVATEMPKDSDALYAVGLLALQTNHLDEAEEYLKRNLALQPDNDQARLYLGQIAEEMKNYTEAARWYREVGMGSSYFEAQARLAMVTAKQGDIAGARQQLHNIQAETDPQRVQLALTEDQILRDAKEYNESLKVLTAALQAMPDDPDLLYARALIAEKLNMIDLHERDLRKLLLKDPKNAHALNALGYTLADRTNRYQEALGLIQQAIALKPDDPFIMDSLGWVYYRMGNNAEAIKILKHAIAIRSDAEISAHLGEVLWVSGDHRGAEGVWNRALKDTPDSEALLAVIKKFKQ